MPIQTTQHARTASRGFTLVEILTVIAVIVILMGIGLAVGPGLLQQGERQLTYVVLNNARSLYEEYDDRTHSGAFIEDTSELIRKCRDISQLENVVARFPSQTISRSESGETVTYSLRDGWGNEILFVPAGQTSQDAEGKKFHADDPEGPYFMSPGPDSATGDLSGNEQQKEQAEDNIFSFRTNR